MEHAYLIVAGSHEALTEQYKNGILAWCQMEQVNRLFYDFKTKYATMSSAVTYTNITFKIQDLYIVKTTIYSAYSVLKCHSTQALHGAFIQNIKNTKI